MKVHVSFNVRNPEWYWTPQQIRESDGLYESWKIINEDKVPKHLPSWTYEVGFDVLDIKENREAIFDLKFGATTSSEIIHTLPLSNMTHVTFIGEGEKAEIAVANAILHSYMGAQQVGRTYYWYFYVKETIGYNKVNDFIWLSDEQFKVVESMLSSPR